VLPIERSGGGKVLNKKVIEIDAGRSPIQHPATHHRCDLPDVPVLPETLLMLELCVQGPVANLRELAEIILGDLGAAIQVMHKAGQESIFANARPDRVEDCISAFGAQACIEAVSRRTVTREMNKPLIREAWSHSREIAQRCKLIAEETIRGKVNPTEAYLTGLFHKIGSLPEILDWDVSHGLPSDAVHAGLMLAEAWFLPQCVVDYFCELGGTKRAGRLTGIVQLAHETLSLTVKG